MSDGTLMTKLYELGRYLNSTDFYELSTFIGVHAGALVFSVFALIMLILLYIKERPRPKLHYLWTWVICSLAFFLIRAVVVYRFGDDGRIFVFALAWWNLTIAGITTLLVYTTQSLILLKNGDKTEITE